MTVEVEVGASNPVKIMANIFISFIGAGVLGLPYAFKEVSRRYSRYTSVACLGLALSLTV